MPSTWDAACSPAIRRPDPDPGLGRRAASSRSPSPHRSRSTRSSSSPASRAERLDPLRPVRADRRARGLGRCRAPRRSTRERLGVVIATGIGGVWTLLDAYDTLKEKGPRRVFPLTVPMLMPNGPAAAVGIELGARAGVHTAGQRLRVRRRGHRATPRT